MCASSEVETSMQPNRASDQLATGMSRAHKGVCLLPAVWDCSACCEWDAQTAGALANSKGCVHEQLSCHSGQCEQGGKSVDER